MVGKIIGVMPLADTERESLWMLPGYMDALLEAGAVPVMLPLTADEDVLKRILRICSGLLFTGGHDVSPRLYGENILPCCGEICDLRDAMESRLFAAAMEKDMPMFGICRGIQLFNVLLGGTLYQDLSSQYTTSTNHHQAPPYDIPAHRVKIIPNTPLHALLKTDSLSVNSYHHQAIKALSPRLETMAVSEDGLVEAVFMKDKGFVRAVQWHPEFCFRTSGENMLIMRDFVNAVNLYGTQK